jgi:hypothetical protein
MSRSPDSTLPSRPIPVVVIVGPTSAKLDNWLAVLRNLEEAPSIQIANLSNVTTVVARWRPTAILIEQELFEFDEREFEELARDVNAELITVEEGSGRETLEAAVLPTVRAALARWRAQTDDDS